MGTVGLPEEREKKNDNFHTTYSWHHFDKRKVTERYNCIHLPIYSAYKKTLSIASLFHKKTLSIAFHLCFTLLERRTLQHAHTYCLQTAKCIHPCMEYCTGATIQKSTLLPAPLTARRVSCARGYAKLGAWHLQPPHRLTRESFWYSGYTSTVL